MEICKCLEGHFCDRSKYVSCPHCGSPLSSDMNAVILKCAACGQSYSTHESIYCPFCGTKPNLPEASEEPGDLLSCDGEGNLYSKVSMHPLSPIHGDQINKDPVEQSIFYKQIEKELEELMQAENSPDRPYLMGSCHSIWKRKQQILLERYHICWRTPDEMNPHIHFD